MFTYGCSLWSRHAGKQIKIFFFFTKCFIFIDVILILNFYALINYLIFIKLVNPLQFLHKPQFGKLLRNVIFTVLLVVNNNEWNIFSYSL